MKPKPVREIEHAHAVNTAPDNCDGTDDTLILRTAAAAMAGISVPTLRRLERTSLPPALADEEAFIGIR
jgi:hypothetical protein